MFLESRATSARMSTPSMTSPTWLYCGFPERRKKKCLRSDNVSNSGAKYGGKVGENLDPLWAITVGTRSAPTQLMTTEGNTWGTWAFYRGKKIFRYQILAWTFEGCTMHTEARVPSKWARKLTLDSLRFQLWNLSRLFCQLPMNGGFQKQTAALKNEKAWGMRAQEVTDQNALEEPLKTRKEKLQQFRLQPKWKKNF